MVHVQLHGQIPPSRLVHKTIMPIQEPYGWTVEALKDHLTGRIDDSNRHQSEMLELAIEKVITKINEADLRYTQRFNNNERIFITGFETVNTRFLTLDGVLNSKFAVANEFRDSLNDESKTHVTR